MLQSIPTYNALAQYQRLFETYEQEQRVPFFFRKKIIKKKNNNKNKINNNIKLK